jgi:hypothetical protein
VSTTSNSRCLREAKHSILKVDWPTMYSVMTLIPATSNHVRIKTIDEMLHVPPLAPEDGSLGILARKQPLPNSTQCGTMDRGTQHCLILN